MKTHSRFLVFFTTILIGGLLLSNLPASASRLSSMSDTLSSHEVNGVSNHAISFRATSGIAASGILRMYMADAASSLNSITVNDMDLVIAGTSVPLAGTATSNTWGVSTNTTTRVITFTSPSDSNLASAGQTLVIRIGTNAVTGGTGTQQIRNAASSGSKYISIASGNDVGLLTVRIGIEDSSGANITPTVGVSGTAPAPPTTAAVPAPAPAPVSPTPTQTPTAPTTEPAPTTTTTTTQPTAQPVTSEPVQTATPPPTEQQAPKKIETTTPPPAPKVSTEEKVAVSAPSVPIKEEPVLTAPAQFEPKIPPAESVSIPPTVIEPSPTPPLTASAPPTHLDGFAIAAPRIELPTVLPPNAIVQTLERPVSQRFSFAPPVQGGPALPSVSVRFKSGDNTVEAKFSEKAIANAARGVEAKISAQPIQNAEFWLGIRIPGPQFSNKLVLGNKVFFISANRLDPETAADVAVTQLSEPIPVTFCFTSPELEGINPSTIRIYSFDSIDGIRSEETSWNAQTRCATALIGHLSVFAALAEVLPGATPNQIYVLPSEQITKIESDVKPEKLEIKDSQTGEEIESFGAKIYATPDAEIALCIPSATFRKPVKKMSLFIGSEKFPFAYDRARNCYSLTIKAPSQRGKQQVTLKIVYADDQVQTVELETVVTGALQAKLLPRVQKAAKQVQEVAVVVNETVKETVQTTQPLLQSTAVTAAPLVTVANPAVSANIINWYHYLNHFISSVLSLLGLRRKRKPWGVVYDSISKTPLDLAIVRLFEKQTNKLIDTQVTDKNGRFSFIAPPGEYSIEVRKPPFVFPSKIVPGSLDGDYTNVYHQEPLTISKPDEAITLSVPLDPQNPKDQQQKISFTGGAKVFFTKYSKATLLVSLTVSGLLAVYTPNSLNLTLLGLNCVYVIFQVLVLYRVEKPWGIVFDMQTSEGVPLAAISIFDAAQKKLLRTRLTDYVGRFNFLAPAGEYLMIVSKEKYTFPPATRPSLRKYKNIYMGGNVKVKKDKALVKINIPLEPKKEGTAPTAAFTTTAPASPTTPSS